MAVERYALLFGSFIALLIAAEIFINGIEWAGNRLGISEGATGSVLAAIGTVLPETMIPIIAIFFTAGEAGNEVGVGAILGGPFLLATIVMFLIGASVLLFSSRRDYGKELVVDTEPVKRNLSVFFIGFSLALAAALIHNATIAKAIGVGITLLYVGYLYVTLTSGEVMEEEGISPLHLGNVLRRLPVSSPSISSMHTSPHSILIVAQVFFALGVFVVGAHTFVNQIEWLAVDVLHVPVAVIALLIAPLATELPETFNSYFWIAKDKDTLALGNITGAMAFQGTIPATIGILFTSWNLTLDWGTAGFLNAFSVLLALMAGGIVYLRVRNDDTGRLTAGPFLVGGAFYLAFIIVLVYFVMNFDLAVTPH
ncbi:MAG: sodium:calcium antiporter [Halodesulfurarchaeum sp.]